MVTGQSDPTDDESIGGGAAAAGQSADPIATRTKDLAQRGGPLAGEPAAGGSGLPSGDRAGTGRSEPGGPRPEATGVPASNEAAPPYRSAMDDDLHKVDASQGGGPRSGGA